MTKNERIVYEIICRAMDKEPIEVPPPVLETIPEDFFSCDEMLVTSIARCCGPSRDES